VLHPPQDSVYLLHDVLVLFDRQHLIITRAWAEKMDVGLGWKRKWGKGMEIGEEGWEWEN
jgi:hypothetical protein